MSIDSSHPFASLQDHAALALAEAARVHAVGDETERADRQGDVLMKHPH
jgi:hypothetical protein